MRLEETIAKTLLEVADGLENNRLAPRPKVALAGMGNEHGEQNAMEGAVFAAQHGADVYYIGTLEAPGVTTIPAADEDECHKIMEDLLDSGKIDGAVAMHYPFPIGVSTVGRVITPAFGKEMFIANTTGTSSADRVEAMILNAICGIIAAKASGIEDPSLGILNLDGSRQAEIALNRMKDNGFSFRWAESARADGGAILRGNDVMQGTPDVLVCDSLTGNVLTKMLSTLTSGGSYETCGFGYGPGIGRGYRKLISIISRASGAPTIGHALLYTAQVFENGLFDIADQVYAAADKAGLGQILEERKASANASVSEEIKCPPEETCTASIPGIDVMDLEDAAKALWKAGIYAKTGMGCTGPLVMMSEANHDRSVQILKEAGYIG